MRDFDKNLKLVYKNHSALTRPCEEVEDIEKEVRPWMPYLIREMRRNFGIGITANQVGINKAVFVTDVPGDGIRIWINPEIEKRSKAEVDSTEGCLSFPGEQLRTNRKRHVIVRALNLQGKEFVIQLPCKYPSKRMHPA